MKVLVTGGLGYIGGSVSFALKDQGYTPIIIDYVNDARNILFQDFTVYSKEISSESLKKITKEHPDIKAVVHAAASISVPQSEDQALAYYQNNVCMSLEVFKAAVTHRWTLILSSSGSVYGDAQMQKLDETTPLNPQSVYAQTKVMNETMLQDLARTEGLKVIILRYFNPIGVDPKSRCGPFEPDPKNLLGLLLNIYQGKAPYFTLAGNDWKTKDGSAIRDYVHVWDLARAHILALKNQEQLCKNKVAAIINLGKGQGITVKEFIEAFEKVAKTKISVNNSPKRKGDVMGFYADNQVARRLLGWEPTLSIEQGIQDSLAWFSVRQKRFGY